MTWFFLTIINMSIMAGWITVAVWLLRTCLKLPKWICCVLWGIVALRLLLPFTTESVFSLIPSREVIAQNVASAPAVQTGIPSINGVINPVLAETMPQGSPRISTWIENLSILWLVGTVLMLVYGLWSYLRLRLRLRGALHLETNVYAHDRIFNGFILGILRPRIYVPSGLEPQQLSYVLTHERTHLKRLDHWWKPVGYCLLCLHWFNPLLWAAYILLCRDIEQACDEKVICSMTDGDRCAYSQTLVACSVHQRMILVCPVAFGEITIKSRIKRILHYKKPAFWVVIASVLVCAVAALCFLTDPVQCTHNYQSRISQMPTCDREGVEIFTCTGCKYCYTRPVAMLDHAYAEGQTVTASTCMERGSLKYICPDCGHSKQESAELAPHIPGEPYYTVQANCTEQGSVSATCSLCGEVFVTEILQTNQLHDLEETVIKEATCTEPGEGLLRCKRCGHEERCVYEVLPHDYKEFMRFLGSCRSNGSLEQKCTGCGASRWLDLPKGEHFWYVIWLDNKRIERCPCCGSVK